MDDKKVVETVIKRFEKEREIKVNSVYYFTQIDLSYNSNHIEGSTLTHRQTESLFDKGLFYPENDKTEIKKDDIIETSNHFRAFDYILDFHVCFEKIHPFQDGNGRVGRLIMFKECLKNGIVPIIIYDEVKNYYYRGLNEWDNGNRGYLKDTALSCQDTYREKLAYFDIK